MQFLSLNEVSRITGLSASTIWRAEKRGDFPRRVQIGLNRVAWLRSEIDAWASGRLRQRDATNLRPGDSEMAATSTSVEGNGP